MSHATTTPQPSEASQPTLPALALSYGSAERDWPEDFARENGNYLCRCFSCGESFIGHKRRVTCKKCADEAAAWWASLMPEQAASEREKQQQAVREILDSRFSPNTHSSATPNNGH